MRPCSVEFTPGDLTSPYRVWLAAHSVLMIEDQKQPAQGSLESSSQAEGTEAAQSAERCRLAKMASMFATQETQLRLSEQAATESA
jgi:hypothetical protein